MVELPLTGGNTRIVQPFRLKIPNRALPATFFYEGYGYKAQTSYSLRAYLTFQNNPSEPQFQSKKVILIVRQFAQIDKQQNVTLRIPKKCWCFLRSEIKRTDLVFTYDKLCYYFQSDQINCKISYVPSEEDLNASSIGGVSHTRQINPISLTVQFMFELMELKTDQTKIHHSVKIGNPSNILWDGKNNMKVRVPLKAVFQQNKEMKFSQSCSGEYFSCKWYLVWVFTFPGHSHQVKTRIWLQTRDFKPQKEIKRPSLRKHEEFFQIEQKQLSRLDVDAETSSLGSYIRKNTPQDVQQAQTTRPQIHNLFSEESQYDSRSSKKIKPEKEPLLVHIPIDP